MTIEGRSTPRYIWIDPIRMLCALAVVAVHYCVAAPRTSVVPDTSYLAPDILVYGQFGVEIFFVISGFVISVSMIGRNWIEFLRARFLRLYPAYWIAVTLTAATLWIVQPQIETLIVPTPGSYLANLTMFQSVMHIREVDPVYWSLAVELRFYLLIALLMLLRVPVGSLLFLSCWLALCIVAPYLPGPFYLLTLQGFAPCFIAGIVIQKLVAPEARLAKMLVLVAAMAAQLPPALARHAEHMAMQLPAAVARHAQHDARDLASYDPYVASGVVWAGTFLLIAAVFAPNPRHGIVLLKRIGAATYPLYLIHCVLGMLALTYAIKLFPPYLAAALVAAGMIALSAVIALWLEPRLRARLASLIDGVARLFGKWGEPFAAPLRRLFPAAWK